MHALMMALVQVGLASDSTLTVDTPRYRLTVSDMAPPAALLAPGRERVCSFAVSVDRRGAQVQTHECPAELAAMLQPTLAAWRFSVSSPVEDSENTLLVSFLVGVEGDARAGVFATTLLSDVLHLEAPTWVVLPRESEPCTNGVVGGVIPASGAEKSACRVALMVDWLGRATVEEIERCTGALEASSTATAVAIASEVATANHSAQNPWCPRSEQGIPTSYATVFMFEPEDGGEPASKAMPNIRLRSSFDRLP
jgi:hypothetical protein